MRVFRVFLVVCALVMTASAQITDSHGVILIDQQHALVGGIGPGDAGGFPVTITSPGSYKLTSNLTVRDLNTMAIVITANHVALDLNGFSIMGPNLCPPPDLPCPSGGGNGVLGQVGPDVTVKNGSVTGMGGNAVQLIGGGIVRNVTVSDNGRSGILVGNDLAGGVISDSFATHNGGDGLVCYNGLAARNVSTFNHSFGLYLGWGSAYSENVLGGNFSGPRAGSGVNLGRNSCDGAVCP